MTQTKEKNYVAIAARYAKDVVSGKSLACQWTIKACRRQIDDLEKAKSRKYLYRFDRNNASRVCRFIEMLPHIKGEWAKTGGRIELQLPACQNSSRIESIDFVASGEQASQS